MGTASGWRRQFPQWVRWVGLCVPFVLTGCANVLVHDENRDKQAQDLRKAVAEAKIADTVAGLEKSFADMAALEATRARDRAAYLFELELRVVSRAMSLVSKYNPDDTTTDGLRTVVDARLATLMGTEATADGLNRYRRVKTQIGERQKARDESFNTFLGSVAYRFESCQAVYAQSADPAKRETKPSDAWLDSIPTDKRDLARLKFPELVEKCKHLDAALEGRGRVIVFGKDVQGRLSTLQEELDDYERDLIAARAKLKANENAAVAPADEPGKLAKVEERAQRLGGIVHTLANGVDAVSTAGEHALAVERLARLEGLLGAIAATPPDGKVMLSDDDRVAVAIIRDLPALADEADKLMKDATRPRLVPFVAAVEQQRIVVRGFEAIREVKLKRMDAVRKQLAAILDEGDALIRVLSALDSGPAWQERSIGALLAELKGKPRITFLRALAVYADEVKAYRVEGAGWAARVDALAHEEGLVRSKFAAAQWDALIDMMATVLTDYHAAGIKKADLAEFFKALGLVTIGVGAAQ